MVDAAKTGGTTRVLVPLDGSSLAEQAIPYGRAVAGDDGDVVFLQVCADPEPVRALRGNVIESASDVLQTEQQAATASLQETAQRWSGVLTKEPSFEVAPGDPSAVILETAERLNCDYIALASHGRGAVARLTFGSVADRISRSATIPVLIIRPSDAAAEIGPVEIRRVLVPYDGSEVAAEALPVASGLAAHLGVCVHVIEAINPSALVMPAPMGGGIYPAEIYTEIEDELTVGANATLSAAAERLRATGVDVTTAVVVGAPVAAIEEAVEDGDIIVMASHGRSGVRRWLLGSTAEKLIRTGPAPVMLVPAATRGDKL